MLGEATLTSRIEQIGGDMEVSEKNMGLALATIGHEKANDPAFVRQVTSYFKHAVEEIENAKNSSLGKSAVFMGQQMSRNYRLMKTTADGSSLLLNLSPGRAVAAIAVVTVEKASFAVGLTSDEQVTKCGAALAGLAANTAAMMILGAGTGGVGIFLTVASLTGSYLNVKAQCEVYTGSSSSSSQPHVTSSAAPQLSSQPLSTRLP
jgi:hypothetical protein